MDRRTRMQGLKGIVFVAAGVALLGAQAGWWEAGSFLLWIGWGTVCLIWSTGVWAWRESWPLLLVMYGVALAIWPSGSTPVRRDGSRVG
jgi:hypothetical protein